MISHIDTADLRIRAAVPKDVPPFAAHFPPMFQFPTESRLFVVEDSFGKVLGGGYVLFPRAQADGTAGETFFDLHVFDLKRYAAVAGLLLNVFRNLSRARGRTILLPMKAAPENSAFGELLIGHGFEPSRTFKNYIVETARLLADFEPVYRRLSDRRRIPSETNIIPLREAPFVPTRELIQWTIGSNPLTLEQQLGNRTFCQGTSKVVRIGSRIVGVLLARAQDNFPEVVYLAVEPDRRNSWVYVALCTVFLRDISDAGHARIRLSTFNPAVMHSAERAGGQIVAIEKNFRLQLQ